MYISVECFFYIVCLELKVRQFERVTASVLTWGKEKTTVLDLEDNFLLSEVSHSGSRVSIIPLGFFES